MIIKKEFETYWSEETVYSRASSMNLNAFRFFDHIKNVHGNESRIVMPDNMPFDQMAVFAGKKTRVTIETIE